MGEKLYLGYSEGSVVSNELFAQVLIRLYVVVRLPFLNVRLSSQ